MEHLTTVTVVAEAPVVAVLMEESVEIAMTMTPEVTVDFRALPWCLQGERLQ
jgi:hypothetical protein